MDLIPHKFLDLPTVKVHESWPNEEGFHYLGHGLRLDYSTPIHTEDGSLKSFFHDFSSGVKIFEPTTTGDVFRISVREGMIDDSRDKPYELNPAVDPIIFGIVDRIILLTPENRQLALIHPDVGIEPEMAQETYFVAELPPSYLAWDPEERQLVVASSKRDPLLVIRDGYLNISDEGMIVG